MNLFTKVKFLLSLLVFASISSALAQVNIIQPTGGLNISNDLSSVSPLTPGYTPIGSIVIAEKDLGDFTAGASRTLIFTRPTGWQFAASTVTAVGNGNQISNVSATNNTTTITVTYTVTGSTDGGNSITISGIQAQSTTNTLGTAAYIYRSGGTGTINGLAPGSAAVGAKVAPLSKIAGNAVKLLALLPNQSVSAGSASGKAGTPAIPAVGVPFNVRVYATDYAWNITTSTNEIAISTDDSYAVPPANGFLDNENGAVFSIELRTPILSPAAASRTITATSVNGSSITANTTTATRVNKGAFAKMLAVFPGETFEPSSVTGKSGTALAPEAGSNYGVTVYSVDKWWNSVSSTNSIAVTATGVTNHTTPAVQGLTAGVRTYNLVFRNIGETPTITATNSSDGTKTLYSQTVPSVVRGTFAKLQILLPGETAAPGTAIGKTGSPNAQVAGTPFTVTVNAVDGAWNIVSDVADEVELTTSDVNAVMPSKLAMTSGVATFTTVALVTGGARTITATNFTDNSKTLNTSPNVTVGANSYNRLVVTLPGETLAAGTATGKTGTPNAVDVGTQVTASVYSVDAYFNRTAGNVNPISITSSDANAVLPVNNTLNAGTRTFNVRLMTGGVTSTITASTGGITSGSTSIAVNGGTFTKLQILLPGETAAPGTLSGKTGTPTARVAGIPFTVTVNAVDAAWNIMPGITDEVELISTDANAVMPARATMANGVATFATVTLVTGGTRTITARDYTDNSKTLNTSPNVTVGANSYNRLVVTLPGEILAAGTATGKTGTPTAVDVGTVVIASVYSVDAYFNRTAANTSQISITSSDASAVLPANNTLAAGTRNFNVRLMTGGVTSTITASTGGGITSGSTSIAVNGGTFTKLQILLPGETAAPGTLSGKTGAPTPRVAGTPFTVTVNAVDAAWNIMPGITDEIELISTDANAVMPARLAMVNGVASFNTVALVTGGTRTITARNYTDNSKTENISPNVTVGANNYVKLQILLPNEVAAPGTATGKTGASPDRSAGTQFSITVNAVDAYWNRVASVTDMIQITSSDANSVLPANNTLSGSTRNFNVTLRTLGAATITAATGTPATPGITSASSNTNVAIGGFAKLQLLMPGETAAPGTATGKTGSPSPRVAGVPFSITVNAVDAAWHVVNTVTDVVNFTATSDQYAELPVPTPLVAGTLTRSVTYRIGSATVNRRLRVSHNTDNTKTFSESANFAVNIGPFTRLLVLLPGESQVAGHPNGKTGVVANQGKSVAFNVIVRATDAAFNSVAGVTDKIGITSSEVGAGLPIDADLVASTKTFSVTLHVEGSSNTITATDVSDGTKTAFTTVGVPVLSPSSTTDYFRSVVASGDWSNSTSWQSSGDNLTWKSSTLNPTTASRGITVRNGNTINVTANLTIDDVLIETGGQVTLTTGTLTVANGLAPIDFKVEGILRSNSRAITSTGVLEIANGGKYQHNYTTTSGTLPTLTWTTGSICEIVGYTNFVGDVLGSNQTFSDFVWNTTGQLAAGSPSLLAGFTARNFTVTSTGLGTLSLASTGGNTTITGNYTQTAGKVLANKTSGTQNLNLAGNFSVNGGTFGSGAGDVNYTFSGTTQSLANAGTVIEFKNVVFNGGTKTMTGGSFAVATNGVLTLGNNTILNSDGHLTILSSASSSGRIAPIPSGSNLSEIRGNVIVQRFITGGAQDPYRTYRMISSPIYDNGNAGNRTYSYSQFIDDMIITGSGGTTNGFDASPLNNASAWVYSGSFQDVTNINTSLSVGKSAYIYYRGNKLNPSTKLNSPYADPESIVMDFEGVLNQQNVAVTLNAGGNLVGNPYASSIDWNSAGITKSNLFNNVIRIWNPTKRSYATYNGSVGVPEGVASNIIPAGQGFFVQAATGGGTLTFSESAKVSAQAAPLLMSTPVKGGLELQKLAVNDNSNFVTQAAPATELRVTLSPNVANGYSEETAVVFQAGRSANYIASEDATYVHNYSATDGGQKVFLSSLSSEERDLVINYMPEVASGSAVKLHVNSYNAGGDYQLKVSYKDVPAGYTLKLRDNFLSTVTTVENGDTYSFNVDKTKANSFGGNRFSLSFEGSTLPVKYESFTAAKTNQGVLVKWSTATEINNNRFEVERAGDDKVYEKLHTELPKGNGSSYSYVDRNPLIGNNYYRIIQFDNDNVQTKTDPKVVNYTGDINAAADVVSVFPNPVISNFTVKYNGTLKASQQTLKVVSTTGQVLLTKNVSKNQLLSGHELDISGYASGLYVVEIYENGAQRIGQMKVVKQ